MITQKTLRIRKILHFKTTQQVTELNTTLSQRRRKNTFQFFPAGMNKVSYSIFKCKIKCQACSIWVSGKKKREREREKTPVCFSLDLLAQCLLNHLRNTIGQVW